VSREELPTEKRRGYWRSFASRFVCILGRVSSPSDWWDFLRNLEFRCHEIPSDELNSSKGSGSPNASRVLMATKSRRRAYPTRAWSLRSRGELRWASSRQPYIERRSVNPPVGADFEAGKIAVLDEPINCRGVRAQYFSNLTDSKDCEFFHLPRPDPFHDCATSDDVIRIAHTAETAPGRQGFVSNFHWRGRAPSPPMQKLQ